MSGSLRVVKSTACHIVWLTLLICFSSCPKPLRQVLFMERAQALLHGDLHTGSLLVTPEATHVIDAEFAFYGPIAFDVGKFIGNLFIAFFASDGHATNAEPRSGDRRVCPSVSGAAARCYLPAR